MTKLERVLSKRALAAVDAYRALHGIRTRRAAITAMVLSVAAKEETQPRVLRDEQQE
ncbi:MAG: hypothetical protein HC933_10515 [Pleurocapsa sp. SU_196_0]|nr:hypothetical protein [Pleurocapsa sp. SU_196_0]